MRVFYTAFVFILLSSQAFASLRFGAYNIRNYGSITTNPQQQTDRYLLANILAELNYDFFSVEEINDKADFTNLIHSYFPQYEVVLSKCGGSHAQHLGFVYNKNKFRLIFEHEELALTVTRPNQVPACKGGSRPAMMGQFIELSTGQKFLAIALHLKAGGTQSSIDKRYFQFQTLSNLLQSYNGQYGPYVIMGDLNTTEYNKGEHNYYHQLFKQFVYGHGLTDLSEKIGCTSYWWGGVDDGYEYPSLLDHVLMSNDLVNTFGRDYDSYTTAHCYVAGCYPATKQFLGSTYSGVSDHCPILTEF